MAETNATCGETEATATVNDRSVVQVAALVTTGQVRCKRTKLEHQKQDMVENGGKMVSDGPISIEVEDDLRESYDELADQVVRCRISHIGRALWLREEIPVGGEDKDSFLPFHSCSNPNSLRLKMMSTVSQEGLWQTGRSVER
ncbi:unnamed protein product [Sphenostylis stenocarpa]|uniref:Uncharacterized protein n=1 Tax=Sphenostylis stenocarpa TaxID=92480 RepID=A0AA86SCL2_9FABA|nr:unnamed protein product [Sphenostylis stenocarpa]